MCHHYFIPRLLLVLVFSLAVNAQTRTTTDATGRSIIQVITTNAQGQTTTSILSTLTSGTSTNTGTTTTTTTQGPGPVAQPAPTTASPGAPFQYTYTTVVNGATQTLTDTFTPTSPPTSSVTPTAIGTVWAYSSWYSAYGPPKGTSSGHVALPLAGLGGAFVYGILLCIIT